MKSIRVYPHAASVPHYIVCRHGCHLTSQPHTHVYGIKVPCRPKEIRSGSEKLQSNGRMIPLRCVFWGMFVLVVLPIRFDRTQLKGENPRQCPIGQKPRKFLKAKLPQRLNRPLYIFARTSKRGGTNIERRQTSIYRSVQYVIDCRMQI